jgi:hypothetical protein
MTTALTIVRARSTSNRITHWAFDESSRRDAEALARLRIASPDYRECRVTVDFDPAGSAALNRPVRELVEVERDRLAGLLAEASNHLDWTSPGINELSVRIDAALVPVSVKGAAA